MELILSKEVKENNSFFKYISSIRKTWDNVGPFLNGEGVPVTEDADKVALLDAALMPWLQPFLLRPALRNPSPRDKKGSLENGRLSLG